MWKPAGIFPIPKEDNPDLSSFLPILFTSLISKTMETITTKHLLAFFKTNNLLKIIRMVFGHVKPTGGLLAYAVYVLSTALESYHRSIAFRVAASCSKPHFINSGVPKDSVISHVLLTLLVNHLLSYAFQIFAL